MKTWTWTLEKNGKSLWHSSQKNKQTNGQTNPEVGIIIPIVWDEVEKKIESQVMKHCYIIIPILETEKQEPSFREVEVWQNLTVRKKQNQNLNFPWEVIVFMRSYLETFVLFECWPLEVGK